MPRSLSTERARPQRWLSHAQYCGPGLATSTDGGQVLLKMVFLGFINKIMGGIFGSFKFALLLSLCLVFFESLNTSLNLFDTSILDSSFFYEPIKEVGDKLTSIFNSNKESINFFN